jgi:hypothetical protein
LFFYFFFIELLLFYYFLRLFSFQLRLLVLVFFGVVAAFLGFDFEGRAGLALLLRLLVQRGCLFVALSISHGSRSEVTFGAVFRAFEVFRFCCWE